MRCFFQQSTHGGLGAPVHILKLKTFIIWLDASSINMGIKKM